MQVTFFDFHSTTLPPPLPPTTSSTIVNSPCVPMRERHECHCMLFLTEENDFSGDETVSVIAFRSPVIIRMNLFIHPSHVEVVHFFFGI